MHARFNFVNLTADYACKIHISSGSNKNMQLKGMLQKYVVQQSYVTTNIERNTNKADKNAMKIFENACKPRQVYNLARF